MGNWNSGKNISRIVWLHIIFTMHRWCSDYSHAAQLQVLMLNYLFLFYYLFFFCFFLKWKNKLISKWSIRIMGSTFSIYGSYCFTIYSLECKYTYIIIYFRSIHLCIDLGLCYLDACVCVCNLVFSFFFCFFVYLSIN